MQGARATKDKLPTGLNVVEPPRKIESSSEENDPSENVKIDPHAINKENYEKLKKRIEGFLVERGMIPSKDERRNRRLTTLIIRAEADNLVSKYRGRMNLKKELPEEFKIYSAVRIKEFEKKW